MRFVSHTLIQAPTSFSMPSIWSSRLGDLPPESYERESCGSKPERPGVVKIGTLRDPGPVTGLAVNISLMPQIAPQPLRAHLPPLKSAMISKTFPAGPPIIAASARKSCALPW